MLCEMELKAFTRSRKIATVSFFWSKLDETVSTSFKTASLLTFSECRIALYWDFYAYQWNPSSELEGGAQKF